jgi:hypothetical protein
MAGYHSRQINRGVYGRPSKIKEEYEEFEDSIDQGNKIMALIELSDMIGAIEGYLETNYKGLTLNDLIVMSQATRRAFETGDR